MSNERSTLTDSQVLVVEDSELLLSSSSETTKNTIDGLGSSSENPVFDEDWYEQYLKDNVLDYSSDPDYRIGFTMSIADMLQEIAMMNPNSPPIGLIGTTLRFERLQKYN